MLAARIGTALVLVAGLLAALFWLPPSGWRLLVAACVAIGAYEWAGLAGVSGAARHTYGVLTGIATAGAAFGLLGPPIRSPGPELAWALAGLFWVCIAPLWLVRKWRLPPGVSAALMGWLVLIPPGIALAYLREFDPLFLLAAMALVWVADIAAYFAGRAFGRHKLAPAISPGKTWEGAAGAVIATIVYGFGVAAAFDWPLAGEGVAAFAGLMVGLTAISIVGDLLESLLKRQAGVKDSGHILPGHGGMLDRIDSLTSTLPWIALAAIFLGVGRNA